MNKFWNEIITRELSVEEAQKIIKEVRLYGATRIEWEGFHFYDKNGVYSILLKNGEVIQGNEDMVYSKDTTDWMIVNMTEEAKSILAKNNFI